MANLVITHTSFSPNTLIQSSQVNTNFDDVETWANTQAIHKDASVAFTAVPSGPGVDATSDNQFVRKAMLEGRSALCHLTKSGFSLSHGVGTVITSWTTDIEQPSSYFTVLSNGIQMDIPGWYHISAAASLVPSPTSGFFGTALYRSAVRIEADATVNMNPFGIHPTVRAAGEWSFTAGQNVTMDVAQDSGSSQTCFATLSARFVRPL